MPDHTDHRRKCQGKEEGSGFDPGQQIGQLLNHAR